MIEQWQREDGKRVIPFFSSIPALERAHESNHRAFTLTARGLFQTMPTAHLVLNPNSAHYREFHPDEVVSLLQMGTNQVAERRIIAEPIRVQLGPVLEPPAQMVSSISLFLAQHESVQRAYLAMMIELDPTPSQVLLIGIQGKGSLDKVMQQIGSVIADTKPKHIHVDVTPFELGQGVFGEYFETVEPFYDYQWGKKLSPTLVSNDRLA